MIVPNSSLLTLRETLAKLNAWLPDFPREIWILAAGRGLLNVGQGLTLVYSSLYFVNQRGFSAAQVGLALSSGAIAGIGGRFLAGTSSDAAFPGRKLLLWAGGLAGFGLTGRSRLTRSSRQFSPSFASRSPEEFTLLLRRHWSAIWLLNRCEDFILPGNLNAGRLGLRSGRPSAAGPWIALSDANCGWRVRQLARSRSRF